MRFYGGDNMIIVMTPEDFYDASPYLPFDTILGQPINLADGRCATAHPFTEEDVSYLIEMGGEIVDELPEARGDEI